MDARIRVGFKGGVLGLRTYMEFFLDETDFIQNSRISSRESRKGGIALESKGQDMEW
jgi:hypothetical protein